MDPRPRSSRARSQWPGHRGGPRRDGEAGGGAGHRPHRHPPGRRARPGRASRPRWTTASRTWATWTSSWPAPRRGRQADKMKVDNWKHTIDINLTGLWNTARAGPSAPAGGEGEVDRPHQLRRRRARDREEYVSAKHGVIGLMRSLSGANRRGAASGQLRPAHQRQHDVHEQQELAVLHPGPGSPRDSDIRPVRGRELHVLPSAGSSSRSTSATRSCSSSPTRPAHRAWSASTPGRC